MPREAQILEFPYSRVRTGAGAHEAKILKMPERKSTEFDFYFWYPLNAATKWMEIWT